MTIGVQAEIREIPRNHSRKIHAKNIKTVPLCLRVQIKYHTETQRHGLKVLFFYAHHFYIKYQYAVGWNGFAVGPYGISQA